MIAGEELSLDAQEELDGQAEADFQDENGTPPESSTQRRGPTRDERAHYLNRPKQSLAWQALARCLEVDPEIFFPERGGSSQAARAVCNQCQVRAQCLRYALANREEFGIWGGTSERERRKIKKLAS